MDPFLLVLIVGFGLLWLLTARQRKAQREAANFRAELGPGDTVMTGSGLFGTVVEVDGDIVTIETSPGVTSDWLRAAIAKQASPDDHRTPVLDDAEADGEDEDVDDAYEEYDEEYDADDADGELVDDADRDLDVEVPDDASSLTDDGDEKR